jgi:hypothetical protein
MSFFERHPPLTPTISDTDKLAFREALRRSEEAIERMRPVHEAEQFRKSWLARMPELRIEALDVIGKRGGDPDDDLGMD